MMKLRWLVVALVAGLVAAPPQVLRAQPAVVAPAEISIPAKAMQHIMERHGPGSEALGAGKYARGATPETIRALILEAVRKGTAHPNTNHRPGTLYDYGFAQPIGVTIDGMPTNRIRVVVGRDNQVVTAFPR